MIRLLKYNQIDFEKYDACLDEANALIYAYSWYLDIVTKKKWDVLVWNDYEVVMPIPYGRSRKTYFLKRVMQPLFCQQLGVHSKLVLTKALFELFNNELLKINPHNYSYNFLNTQFLEVKDDVFRRNNYVLSLNQSYADLYKSYSRTKKQRVKSAKNNELQILNNNQLDKFFEFYQIHNPHKMENRPKKLMKKLIKTLIQNKLCEIYQINNSNNETIAMVLFVIFKQRIYYLFSAVSCEGRNKLAVNFVLDFIIEKYSNKDWVLDFEGSDLKGVEKFISAFNAQNQTYYTIYN